MAKMEFVCGASWASGIVGIDGNGPGVVPKKISHRDSFSLFEKEGSNFCPFCSIMSPWGPSRVIILTVWPPADLIFMISVDFISESDGVRGKKSE